MSPDGGTLYIATRNGFFVGTRSGSIWGFRQQVQGLFSTVKLNAANPDIVYLGGFRRPGVFRPSTGQFTSAQLCASATDCSSAIPINAGLIGRTKIAANPTLARSNYVYASMECRSKCERVNCSNGTDTCPASWWGVYESIDSGASFHPLIPPFNNENGEVEFGQAFYDLSLGVDPLNDQTIYFGLVNLWSYNYGTNQITNISSPQLGASADCNAWKSLRFLLPPGIHCDQHAIAFDRAGTLLVGNDGGIYSSPPGAAGSSWNNLNSNLDITQFYPGVAYNSNNPSRLLGGTQTTARRRRVALPGR